MKFFLYTEFRNNFFIFKYNSISIKNFICTKMNRYLKIKRGIKNILKPKILFVCLNIEKKNILKSCVSNFLVNKKIMQLKD